MRTPLFAVVPALATAIVGFAMLGPGAARPVVAARLLGGPLAPGSQRVSFRAAVVERMRGIDGPVAHFDVRAEAAATNGARGEARLPSGPDGTVEIAIPLDRAASGSIDVRLTDASGRLLVEGALPSSPAGWGPGEPFPSALRGNASGDLSIRVAATRGVLAAPFREAMLVEVRDHDAPVVAARVSLSAPGATLDDGDAVPRGETLVVTTGADGRARFGLAPLAHDLELSIDASHAGLSGRWSGILPVVPGALWLEPSRRDTTVRRVLSPVPRDAAYLTVASDVARLFGATIALHPDGRGFAVGTIDWAPIASIAGDAHPLWATLASDPRGGGAGTVGWPVALDGDPFAVTSRAVHDVPLLDGIPRAEKLEASRRGRARLLAFVALAAAALLEGLLLVRAARSGGLRVVIDEAALDGDAAMTVRRAGGGFLLAVALAVTVLAFAAIGIVALWRTSF